MTTTKQLYVSTPKTIIPDLPRFTFEGRIEVIQSESEAIRAVRALKGAPLLGIDTETRPSFRKGEKHKVGLLQVSDRDICFLFRLNIVGMPDMLKSLLENENITKIGISLKDDFGMLGKITDTNPHGFIDLQKVAPTYGISDASLQKIYAIIFDRRISKSQRLTNWEAEELTHAQQIYAAIDAWSCLKIYNYLELNGFDPTQSKYYNDDTHQTSETL